MKGEVVLLASDPESSIGISCPSCGGVSSYVINSRPHKQGVYRRRECCACKHRFTTLEQQQGTATNKFIAEIVESAALALVEAASVLTGQSRMHYIGRAGIVMRQAKKLRGLDLEADKIEMEAR